MRESGVGLTMEYRGVRYNVIQGIERRAWRWSVSIEDVVLGGETGTRADAIEAAERAIDKAMKGRRLRPVPPEQG